MKASVELSLYPLRDDYKKRVVDFILRLRKSTTVKCITNGMSTQLFGDYDDLINLLKVELKNELEQGHCIANIKIGAGILAPDNLPVAIT